MSKKSFIVVGLGFGDEGKGLATDYLCCQTSPALVVRFNGGHQAGHTVVTGDGKRHVFSNFGAGTLRGVPTYWSSYCTFSPGSMLKEYAALTSLGVQPVLYIDQLCPVTTHYDVLYNRIVESERGSSRHGSCGLGFGATIERHHFSPVKLYAQDLLFPEICAFKLQSIRAYYQRKISHETHFAFESLPHDTEDHRFFQYVQELTCLQEKSVITFVQEREIFEDHQPWQQFIFEGAQGVLLDMDFGFYPHVTRSHTTTQNALSLIGNHLKDSLSEVQVLYITRAYQTRHGEGPMTHADVPIRLVNNAEETNCYNEHQGSFRVSPLDVDLLNYALRCDNHFSAGLPKQLLVTCVDQLADSLIPCFQNNRLHTTSPAALPQLLDTAFGSTLWSYSNCGENLPLTNR